MVTEPEEILPAACPACGVPIEGNLTTCFSCGYARRTAPLKKGQLISGRYELTGVLGRGGMGTVYRAHDRSLDEEVALKVLSETTEGTADADRRFRAEIKLARKVRHPNVCAIHEYGQIEDLQYIVMELVHGQDLRKYLDSRGKLSTAEALDLAREIGAGLQAIHDAGVIHRDLKLANVMRDGAGRLRLMDFGIAKSAGDMMSTVTGHIVGTPEYMSPEQVQGQPVDARADIYSLGVMTYELLTGRVPFKAETPLGVIMAQVHEPPRLNDAAIPGQVAIVLGKALEKKPGDRYESAQAFVAALSAARASLDAPREVAPDAAANASQGRKPPDGASLPPQPGPPRWRSAAGGLLVVLALGVAVWLAVRTSESTRNPEETTSAPTLATPSPQTVPAAATPSPPPPTPVATVERTSATKRAGPARPPSPAVPATPTSIPAAMTPTATSSSAPNPTPLPTIAPAATPVAPAPEPAAISSPPPDAAASGYLQIKATPTAQITVDGVDGGTVSEARTLELSPGRHVIRFLHRDYRPLQRIVTIRPGQTVRVFVDLKLDGIAR
jgi:serine/threonine-protein kinase